MDELKIILNYIDKISIGSEFKGIVLMNILKKSYKGERIESIKATVNYYLHLFNKIGILTYYTNHTMYARNRIHFYTVYVKRINIPFVTQLTEDDLIKCMKDKNYIKTFERKCKIKLLKK